MALEGKYDFRTAEPRLQEAWAAQGTYEFDPHHPGQPYTVDTPPPTVSGRIHVGHVYSYTQADVMIRYHRMKGEQVFYPFGFDDNGLPTEIFTENSRGFTAREVGRRAFIDACLALSHEVEGQFQRFWTRLGLSVDWRLKYSTIDPRSRRVSQAAFIDLYEHGNVYRQASPTLWCTTCQTGVAQADVEDQEGVPSKFTTIPFSLDDGGELLIATTRPELLAACVAVFVHPDDKRFAHVVGRTATTPVFGAQVPVLADAKVDPEKGTGAVMCCTFGDVTDIYWWRTYNLPLRIAITPDGRMNELAGPYQGLRTKQARAKILEDLAAAGLVREQKEIVHTVGVHERCTGGTKTELDYLVTSQWFVKLLEHKERWLEAGRRIRWYPEHMRTRYENWIEGLNWDWNISRQRYYGVPFPTWYCRACGEAIMARTEDLPVDPQETAPPVDACPKCGGKDFVPDTDVMDTWATSSVTPQLCGTLLEPLGISPEEFNRRFRPMTLRPNAHDIIRTWDFYTIVRSLYLTGDVPWTDVLIHGHALDPSGKKISKSKLKTAEDPTPMLEQFSADAVRYWTTTVRTGGDTMLSEEVFRNGSKLVTKLWNSAKFALQFLQGYAPPPVPPAGLNATDRWLLDRLAEVIRHATVAMDEYEFAAAKADVERFFWTDLCDNYIELAKSRLYGDAATGANGTTAGAAAQTNGSAAGSGTTDRNGVLSAGTGAGSPTQSTAGAGSREGAQYALYQALLGVLKLLAPFLPHITEEIYLGGFAGTDGGQSIHLSRWPQAHPDWSAEGAGRAGEVILEVADTVRRWKADRQLSVGAALAALRIACPADVLPDLQGVVRDLQSVTRAATVEIVPGSNGTLEVTVQRAEAPAGA